MTAWHTDRMQSPQIPGLMLGPEIGRGARNVVYKAFRDGQTVAIKIKKGSEAASKEDVRRFRREATTLARAKHPNLPAILDTGEVDGQPYLVMEYVEGDTLRAELKKASQLAEPELLALARELASTLQQVHRYGFVHRDIK